MRLILQVELVVTLLMLGLVVMKTISHWRRGDLKEKLKDPDYGIPFFFFTVFSIVPLMALLTGDLKEYGSVAYLPILALIGANSYLTWNMNDELPDANKLIGWYREWPWEEWRFREDWSKKEVRERFCNISSFVSGLIVEHKTGPNCEAAITVKSKGNSDPEEFMFNVGIVLPATQRSIEEVATRFDAERMYHYIFGYSDKYVDAIISDVVFIEKIKVAKNVPEVKGEAENVVDTAQHC